MALILDELSYAYFPYIIDHSSTEFGENQVLLLAIIENHYIDSFHDIFRCCKVSETLSGCLLYFPESHEYMCPFKVLDGA